VLSEPEIEAWDWMGRERRRVSEFYYHLRLVGPWRNSTSLLHELIRRLKQRVALSRGLAPNPLVLLRTSPLRPSTRLTRISFIGDFQRLAGKKETSSFFTHRLP